MARLNNPYTQPPGGYRYHVKETGKWFRGATMDALREDLGKHCRMYALPLPSHEEIETQMCFELGAESHNWCSDELGLPAQADAGAPDCGQLTFASVKQGTMTLLHVLASGRRAEGAEAERRARVCSTCHQNRDVSGCRGCTMPGITAIVDQIRSGRSTSLDDALRVCCMCGCTLSAKVWVPLDILLAHSPSGQMERIKSKAPWCWMLEEAK